MRRWGISIVTVVVMVFIDQATKQAVVNSLTLGESIIPIPALSPLFQITYTQNTGAAFGFVPQAGNLFLIVALVLVMALIIFYRRLPEKAYLTQIGIALIIGGAVGNIINRLQYGAVIDFIHYQIPGVISNMSNLADHAIVLGALLVVITSWWSERTPPVSMDQAV